jgi:hypothetical protein
MRGLIVGLGVPGAFSELRRLIVPFCRKDVELHEWHENDLLLAAAYGI